MKKKPDFLQKNMQVHLQFNEIKNDDIRSRGSFRQVLHAVKNLNKYDFYIILCITNSYKESKKQIVFELKNIFKNLDIIIDDKNIKINECWEKTVNIEKTEENNEKLDCQNSRILTTKGIYTCPFLANDYRGRMGTDFSNYSKKVQLETDFCITCIKNKEQMFAIDKNIF